MSDEEEANTVLFSTFLIANKRCRVYFRRNVLIWEMEHLPYQRQTIPVADIISVNCMTGNSEDPTDSKTVGLGEVNSAFQSGSEISNYSCKFLVINYAKSINDNKWTLSKVVLHHGDQRQVSSWYITLENALRKLNRPKSFLIFVNPYCGKRKGNNIYKRSVKPVLDLAKMDMSVIVTEYQNHAKEVILTADLSKYDAILAVGGDGTISEIVNALVLRTIRDESEDENDNSLKIPRVRLPVAIIPGGSTDTIAYCLNGTRDKKTAAIYAALGTVKGLDVCSVHSDKGLCRYFLSAFSYGFLGDILMDSEKLRWMGPRRYDYAGLLNVLRNRRYFCEVTMTLTNRSTTSKCFRYCGICEEEGFSSSKVRYQEENLQSIKSDLKLFEMEKEAPKKLTVRGDFFLVACANISCACKRSPNGISPYSHLGDGCIDVILFQPQSKAEVVKMLIRSGSKSEHEIMEDLPFVNSYKATEISFKVVSKNSQGVSVERKDASSVWNCDGEVIAEPNVHIKNYRQLVRMFSRRPQQTCADSRTSCFGGCHICSKEIV